MPPSDDAQPPPTLGALKRRLAADYLSRVPPRDGSSAPHAPRPPKKLGASVATAAAASAASAASAATSVSPASAAADPVPPARAAADPVPPARAAADPVPPARAAPDHVPPARAAPDPVPPARAALDPVPPALGPQLLPVRARAHTRLHPAPVFSAVPSAASTPPPAIEQASGTLAASAAGDARDGADAGKTDQVAQAGPPPAPGAGSGVAASSAGTAPIAEDPAPAPQPSTVAAQLQPAQASARAEPEGSRWKRKMVCELCSIEMSGPDPMRAHLAGARHRRAVARQAAEERDKALEQEDILEAQGTRSNLSLASAESSPPSSPRVAFSMRSSTDSGSASVPAQSNSHVQTLHLPSGSEVEGQQNILPAKEHLGGSAGGTSSSSVRDMADGNVCGDVMTTKLVINGGNTERRPSSAVVKEKSASCGSGLEPDTSMPNGVSATVLADVKLSKARYSNDIRVPGRKASVSERSSGADPSQKPSQLAENCEGGTSRPSSAEQLGQSCRVSDHAGSHAKASKLSHGDDAASRGRNEATSSCASSLGTASRVPRSSDGACEDGILTRGHHTSRPFLNKDLSSGEGVDQSRECDVSVGRSDIEATIHCEVCDVRCENQAAFMSHLGSVGHARKAMSLQLNGPSLPLLEVAGGSLSASEPHDQYGSPAPAEAVADAELVNSAVKASVNPEAVSNLAVSPTPGQDQCALPAANPGTEEWVCKPCGLTMNSPSVYKAHMEGARHQKTVRRKSQERRCDICDISVNGPVAWEGHIKGSRHRRAMQPVEIIPCRVCNITVVGERDYAMHCSGARHLKAIRRLGPNHSVGQ